MDMVVCFSHDDIWDETLPVAKDVRLGIVPKLVCLRNCYDRCKLGGNI